MNPPSVAGHVLVAVGWLCYFALHSALASLRIKNRLAARHPRLIPAYRLGYNALAVTLLIPLLWATYTLPSPALWAWNGPLFFVANGLAALAVVGFAWSLRYYDSAEFLGMRQWRERETSPMDQEQLQLSPLHRHVRHPWYSLGLVILWTRDMNATWLLTIAIITVYLFLGSRWEESRLVAYHGTTYRRYRDRVPGLIPSPWRYLTRSEAQQLLAGSAHADPGPR